MVSGSEVLIITETTKKIYNIYNNKLNWKKNRRRKWT